MTPSDLHEVDVDGVPTRWIEGGDGFPVVLVHGIPTSPGLWRHVTPLVRGRTLSYEMTGYGSSIPFGADRDISVSAQASHLLRWLDALGIGRAVLVGHDLGGGVAQIAAVREPARCAGGEGRAGGPLASLRGARWCCGHGPADARTGAGDRFQKVRYGARLAHDLGTELRRIEGAKHWTPEDHPAEIAAAIDEVLVAVADG